MTGRESGMMLAMGKGNTQTCRLTLTDARENLGGLISASSAMITGRVDPFVCPPGRCYLLHPVNWTGTGRASKDSTTKRNPALTRWKLNSPAEALASKKLTST